MKFHSPLTEDEVRRRRRLAGVVEDGDYIHFDITMRDSAPAKASVFVTDAPERELIAAVDRQEGAHIAKFAFMGDGAPKFDRERALFLERNRRTAEAGRIVRDAIRDGARQQVADQAASASPSAAAVFDGKAICDAMRAARFQG